MKRLILSIFLLVTLGFAFSSANLSANSFTVFTTCCDNGDISPNLPTGGIYAANQLFILTIDPDETFKVQFIHVDGNPVAVPAPVPGGGTVVYQIFLTKDSTRIHVCFEKDIDQWEINATCGLNGTITPSGIRKYNEGTIPPVYIIEPDPGFALEQLLVDNVPTPINTPPDGYAFGAIYSNHTIHADFVKLPEIFNLEISYIFLDMEDEPIPAVPGCNTGGYNEGSNPITGGISVTVPINVAPYCYVSRVVEDGVPTDYTNVTSPRNIPLGTIDGNRTLDITFRYDTVGIIEIDIPSLKISPNPVNNIATIIKDVDVIFTNIDVVDIMGNLVMTIKNPTNTINFSSLATGSYIVRFHTAKGFAARSIIKN